MGVLGALPAHEAATSVARTLGIPGEGAVDADHHGAPLARGSPWGPANKLRAVASMRPSTLNLAVFRPLHAASCTVQCSTCNMRELCLPVGLSREDLERIDNRLVASRRKVGRGETLFRTGDRFDSMYAVWTGFFKTVVGSKQGREQVTGFQMA